MLSEALAGCMGVVDFLVVSLHGAVDLLDLAELAGILALDEDLHPNQTCEDASSVDPHPQYQPEL